MSSSLNKVFIHLKLKIMITIYFGAALGIYAIAFLITKYSLKTKDNV